MKKFLLVFLIASCCMASSVRMRRGGGTVVVDSSPQGLTEAVARKSRLPVTWPKTTLEDATNNYTWQPETLAFTDSITGKEVWQFTTPAVLDETEDISFSFWSANGNRLMFHSLRQSNAFTYADGSNRIWMLSNVDGSRLKPAKNSASELDNGDAYVLWSPILTDVLFGSNYNDAQTGSLDTSVLYRVAVSDTTITKAAFLTLTGATRILTKKGISGDGRKAIVRDYATDTFYALTLYPEVSKSLDAHYDRLLNFADWGNALPSPWDGYHDQYMAGAVSGIDGVWNYLMPESTGGDWWRARVTGTGTNSAPHYTSDTSPPYSWGGELEPTNSPVPDTTNPWCPQGTVSGTDCMDYFSHFTSDRWAHYGIFSKSSNSPYGTSIADLRDHKYKVTVFTPAIDSSYYHAEHNDWNAWSDWSISSTWNSGDYSNGFVMAQNYLSSNSQIALAQPFIRYNGTIPTIYQSICRLTQSPDGTKALFHSTFLSNSDDNVQLFWTVAYYPYPPQIQSAAKNSTNVRITFDFNQGTSGSPNLTNPRTYATRGWPDEVKSRAPSPREIKSFRVWTSANGTSWTAAGTTAYSNCSGTNECGTWTEEAWTYDYAQTVGTTRYYAVTSIENSGLESHKLGNVWSVTLDGGGTITSSAESVAYPSSPGGVASFYTTAPGVPTSVTATNNGSGKYTITWSAPSPSTLVRYYNIYAQDGSTPSATQARRIASIAATVDYASSGNFTYIDLMGSPSSTTHYVVTSVDFQGNESAGVGS